MNKNRLWQLTLTEEQLCVAMTAIEDWHRFLCGQCSMDHATSYIDSPQAMHLTRQLLDNEVRPAMFPELTPGASYSWSGGQPNPHMSQAAAISYMLYREIRHRLTEEYPPKHPSIDQSETLTCPDQGPLITVKPLTNERNNP